MEEMLAAWAMGQLLRRQLSEIQPADLVMLASAGLLLLVASIAVYAPALALPKLIR